MKLLAVIKGPLITLLIAMAVVLTVLRLLLPDLGDYRLSLEQRISEAVGQPVRFEQFSARLFGVNPEVTLDQVVILSARGGEPILELDRLLLRVSVLRSIASWRLSPALVRVTGSELSVARRDGRIAVVGMQAPTGEQNSDELITWLLQQKHLEITDTRVNYRDFDQNFNIGFSASVLRLMERRDGLEVSGRLSFEGAAQGSLEMVGQLRADTLNELEKAPWNLYVDIQELHRDSPLLDGLQFGGLINLQGWVFGSGAEIQHIDGDLSWAQPLLVHAPARPIIDGDSLRGTVAWSTQQGGWRGRVKTLEFESGEEQWLGQQMVASYSESVLRIDGGGIDLRVGSRLLTGLLPDDDRYRQWLEGLEPDGQIANFKIDLGHEDGGGWAFRALTADLSEVDISAYEKVPAVSGLSGTLSLMGDRGQVELDSRDVALWFPGLFRQTLEFDQLRTSVDWRLNPGGLLARVHNLGAGNRDLDLAVEGEIEIPAGASAQLQLAAEIRDFDIDQVSRYLPVGVMPPKAVRWLDDALQGGRLVRAGLVWNGALNEFPYDQGGGRFLVTGTVEDGVLDYVPGKSFPPITELDARLRIAGTRMEITGQSGRLLDSSIREVTAVIEELRRKGNHITVVGQVDGPLASGLRYIHESPLKKTVGQHLQDLSVSGDSQLQLALDIPFTPGERVKVDGDLRLAGNQLTFANSRIDLARVSGLLQFDEKGIDAQKLTARLFGGPASVSVKSSAATGLVLTGEGVLQIEQAADYLGWQRVNLASGKAPWQSSLLIRKGGVDLTVDADLQKVAINLPAPLGKTSNETGKLTVNLDCNCSVSGSPIEVGVAMDDAWFADLVLGRGGKQLAITRGVISGGSSASLPEQGVLLSGALPAIDFGLWQRWIAALPSGSGGSFINQVDVEVERLDILGQQIPDLNLQGALTGDQWSLKVASTQAEGDLEYRKNPGRLTLNMDKLSLFTSLGSDSEVEKSTGFGQLPLLDINIANLLVNGRPFGALSMAGELRGDTLFFDAIELAADHSQLSATGRWQDSGDEQASWFSGELSTTDFGEDLTLAGYSKSVSGGKGTAAWQLQWPGSPQQFSVQHLGGELALDVEGGSLLGLEPGLGRLFGVLSLGTLQRRMAFDFRDLVGTGFVFDDLETEVSAVNGQAQIERLRLKGPAADITMTGRIDLAQRQLDLQTSVVPRVTESLPLAVSIGSLGLGAAVFIGQKLLENRIDNVTSTNYEVTGSLDEPEVKVVGESKIKKLLGAGRASGPN